MKRSAVVCLMIMILTVFSTFSNVYGNAGPIIVEEDPVFTLMPQGQSDIAVGEELLIFDFRKDGPYSVEVKAAYQMVNQTNSTIHQKMMFPLIMAPASDFLETVTIFVDGKSMEFEALRLQDYTGSAGGVSPIHYYDDYITRANALNMNDLLSQWKHRSTELLHLNLKDEVQIITFNAPPKDERYEVSIGYHIDPSKSKLIASGFTFRSQNNRGTGSFGKWIENGGQEVNNDGPVFIVLGAPIDETHLSFSETVTYSVLNMKGEALVNHWIDSRMPEGTMDSKQAYFDYVVRKLDDFLASPLEVMELEADLLDPYFYHSYVGALVYDVDFAPESIREVVVQYTAEASKDRTETSRYGALMAYLLNPAQNWKSFQNMTIHIYPHSDQPYLLESSLPIEKNLDGGFYTAHYDTLPEKNLVFRMYHREKPETGLLKTFSNPYILLLIVPAALVLAVLGVVTMVVLLALKKNRMNLRE